MEQKEFDILYLLLESSGWDDDGDAYAEYAKILNDFFGYDLIPNIEFHWENTNGDNSKRFCEWMKKSEKEAINLAKARWRDQSIDSILED